MLILEKKKILRESAKRFRKNLLAEEKIKKDKIIFEKVISSSEYIMADCVLCYFSTEIEIDTINLIEHSLINGKKVAIPLCVDKDGHMIFKYISSLDDTKAGLFNIREPLDSCEPYYNCSKSICILPSLMVDKNNYRLGYGKGYYDKFLKEFEGTKCVLCYKESVVDSLPVYDGFDVKCDMLITD